MFSHLLNGHLTLVCVVSGVLLNAVCVLVFLRFRHGSSPVIQCYLVTLTVWQTALLCNAFLLYCLPTLLFGYVASTGDYVRVYPYVYALANTTHTGSVWIVLTLTVDRFLALCRPLSHPRIGKRSRVAKLMLFVSVMAVLFSAPRFFEVTTIEQCRIGADGERACVARVARTSLPNNQLYWTVYHIVLGMLFVTLGPCVLLFALTLRISVALRRATKRRQSMCQVKSGSGGSRVKETARANVTLVLVIAKFLLSDILPTVIDLLEHLVGNSAFMSSNFATNLVDFSNFLLVLNCSTNFWVFYFCGKRFRQSCLYVLSRTCVGRLVRRCVPLTRLGAGLTTVSPQQQDTTSFFNLNEATCTTRLRHPQSVSDLCRNLTQLELDAARGSLGVQDPLFVMNKVGQPRTQRARSYAAVEDTAQRRHLFQGLAETKSCR